MEPILQNTEQDVVIGAKLLEAHQFWAEKRVTFNFIVGVVGLICVGVFSGFAVDAFDLFGMIMWGIVANAFYSTGQILDSILIVYSKGQRSLVPHRQLLFWLGTIVYVFTSIFFSMVYFLGSQP